MSSYKFLSPAYLKIFFHAAKHPHKPVNGLLLGSEVNNTVLIEDAVPLLHHWTNLSPMMEIGIDVATQYAESTNLKVVGYYQATDRVDDTTLSPVGEKIVGKIKSAFKNAVAFVVNGEKIGTGDVALVPYVWSSSSWRPYSSDPTPFSKNSLFQIESEDLPTRAVSLVRDERRHLQFGDFDDHLEDVSIDWLRNQACFPVQS